MVQVITSVLKHAQAEIETSITNVACVFLRHFLPLSQDSVKAIEAAALQIVLALVVSIESRTTDVGSGADVVDRDRLVALFPKQSTQTLLQHRSCARDTPIYRLL